MLQENIAIRQIEGEPMRRWFSDDFFDLIVWFEKKDLAGFQLSYNKLKDEHALTWRKEHGYSHNRIDDGESRPGKRKATPILVADGQADCKKLLDMFKKESMEIDRAIADFVIKKLTEYSA